MRGLEGDSLGLYLNGVPLAITEAGAFTFPLALDDGASWEVTVGSGPSCPMQVCDVNNATGTIAGANYTNVAVDCHDPELRMFAANWMNDDIYITDDVGAAPATASPRIVAGTNTTLTNIGFEAALTVDVDRDLLYVSDGTAIKVFSDLANLEGDVAPRRSFETGANNQSLCIDSFRDRLYIANESTLRVFDDASQLDVRATASAEISLPGANGCSYDAENDRLYLTAYQNRGVYVLDDVRMLTSSDGADRTMTWDVDNGPSWTNTIEYDVCHDRMYLGSNRTSPTNLATLAAFDDASTLDGAISWETGAAGWVTGRQNIASTMDPTGRLWAFADSASYASLWLAPETWSGALAATEADATVGGVINRGYAIQTVPVDAHVPVDPNVYSSGTFSVRGTYAGDVDEGAEVPSSQADFSWSMSTSTTRRLYPANGATIAPMGPSMPSWADCATATLTTSSISANDPDYEQMAEGNFLCMRTDQGRLARLEVLLIERSVNHRITFDYVTWE
ncbi:MAG: hypothetical protein EP330_28240 [Deltaproteobacteria bacterium]|nr:MAG: hypothetical protein EP330_28240 [Deltaproteobacteria bacterium]